MKLTFYRNNKITDKQVDGKVVDLTFNQLVFNLKVPTEVDITLENLFKLSDSENEAEIKKYMEIKDIGFFIAGDVNVDTKSRRAEHVLNRTMLTFDIDAPKENIWAKFISNFPNIQAIYYTTIRSSKNALRYRILVPLNRPVGSADYGKLMNYIINLLGKSSFDKTTTEFARVMYFPTVCKDQEYGFDYVGIEPLNVDQYLCKIEESFEDVVKRDLAKANYTSPKEKKGVVGAFNRAFSITETIEKFLSDIYKRGSNYTIDAPRYKYKDSKGMPGARVYDNDTMFYSAHDHDPATLKNLDAFNLVKLHLFNNDFTKMKNWALELPEVQAELATNTELEGTEDEWLNQLVRDTKKGTIISTPANLQLILQNDTTLAGMFRTNQLTYMIEVCKDLDIIGGTTDRKFKTLEDADIIEVQIHLEKSKYKVRASKQQVTDIICQVARQDQYDPVKEYLEELEDAWDGVERIPTMFTDYLKADDTPITRAIARKVMAAAIWRVMKPGIKWEGVPVFHGQQGCGKSTFVQKLYKSSMYDLDVKNWVNTTNIDYSKTKEAIEGTKGFWGIELAELANTTTNTYSNELMKAFISNDRPTIRIPYDKFPTTLNRRCVFWGTTNIWLYVSDQTGARRFLPVDCKAYTEEEKFECLQKINAMPVDQLWAEAMSYYKEEKLYFTIEEEKQLNILRAQHTEESSYEAILSMFVNSKITLDWVDKTPMERRDFFQVGNSKDAIVERTTITLSEIAYEALGKPLSDIPRKALRDIEVTLYNLGWQVAPYPLKTVYGQSKTFIKRGGKKNDS